MRLLGREFKGFAQWLIIFVMVLLVSSGLCGVQFAVVSGIPGSLAPFDGLIVVTGYLELAAMIISAAGTVVVLIAWVLYAVVSKLKELPRGGPRGGPE